MLFPLVTLKAGDLCPCCVEAGDHGRLYKTDGIIILSLVGQPLITGTRYEVEKVRCSFCGEYFSADVPETIKNLPKYAPSCSSTLAVARYWFGSPFKRVEALQAIHQIPLADSTQHDLTKKLAEDVTPIYEVMESLSANTELAYFDDTPNRILEQKNIIEGSNRKGVFTTAIVSKHQEHLIYLYFTSGRYAGENIDLLLQNRNTISGNFATMSDASSNNRPKHMDDELFSRWIMCFCLVHGRRNFFKLLGFYDKECSFVLEMIGRIYKHERICKQQRLDDDQRLKYHQQHSLPLMLALRTWLSNKLLYREVEPNSELGKSISYMLRHWDKLTRFLHHPGAPIDNSICERAIKVAIRHRRNSLFYKTYAGAKRGDKLMSIICTAVRCGINPVKYLDALQIYHLEMKAHPELWLPWNYLDAIQKLNREDIRSAA